jgi:hypothetical protein
MYKSYYNSFLDVRYKLFLIAFLLVLSFVGCNDEENPVQNGKIVFRFDHKIYGSTIQTDTLIYINEAGNPYLISEIQYFISDVILYHKNGFGLLINSWKDIHYVDTDLTDTHTWEVYDDIPPGTYDSIAFTFGISKEKNISFMYVNPPESFMFWPEYLGGGYHYLKLNGKWRAEEQTTQTTPFNCHLGIGQIYFSYPDSIIGFIQNDFRVSLHGSSFELGEGQKKEITLTMNVEEWFNDPYVYDLDVWGSYTMQNQDAMQMLKENGYNVFSVSIK